MLILKSNLSLTINCKLERSGRREIRRQCRSMSAEQQSQPNSNPTDQDSVSLVFSNSNQYHYQIKFEDIERIYSIFLRESYLFFLLYLLSVQQSYQEIDSYMFSWCSKTWLVFLGLILKVEHFTEF